MTISLACDAHVGDCLFGDYKGVERTTLVTVCLVEIAAIVDVKMIDSEFGDNKGSLSDVSYW